MLVLTTNALTNGDFPDISAWPGPRALIVLPRSGLSCAAVQNFCSDFVVLEFLQPVEWAAARLVDLFALPLPIIEDAEWPLVYLDRPLDLSRLADEFAVDSYAISADLTEEGRLSRLNLGDMILSSPLFPEFLGCLRGRQVDDATLLELLDEVFSWKCA